MPTLAEELAERRNTLARIVQQNIRAFEEDTGFVVTGFDILHHYSNGRVDADLTTVTSVNIDLVQKG